MVKIEGKIGTLDQIAIFQPFFVFSLLLPFSMLKNAFKKYPPQNRTNVQIKGGGGPKAF